MDDYNFYMVASQRRLADGTPYMRTRVATIEKAREIAEEWARNSDHTNPYIVYKCTAVGEARQNKPPVSYRSIRAKKRK